MKYKNNLAPKDIRALRDFFDEYLLDSNIDLDAEPQLKKAIDKL